MCRKGITQDISHDYVEERLSGYIDGKLPETERLLVRKHLQGCQRCQSSLDTLGWTVRLLKQVPPPPLPRQFTLPLTEAKPARVPWGKWGLATASALAALAFVFLATVDFLSGRSAPAQLALPAATAVERTLVAVVAPTVAPSVQDLNQAPASAPLPATETPEPTVRALAQPTSKAVPTRAPVRIEVPSPTVPLPPIAKSEAASPTCEACGGGIEGGIGGGPPAETTQTPEMNRVMLASQAPTAGTVRQSGIAVRSSPSEEAEEIGVLIGGTQVQVVKRDKAGTWLEIVFPLENAQGLTGWVLAKSITLPVPVDQIPIDEPPPEAPALPPGNIGSGANDTETPTPVVPEASPSATPTATVGTPLPTETSPPTPTGQPAATLTPVAMLSSPFVQTQIENPPTRSTPIPSTTEVKPDHPSFIRLSEVVSLVASLLLGAISLLVTRK